MPTVIDLFAGAGGLSLGAARAGFNVLAAVEWDTRAISSHKINFPNTQHLQIDILSLNGNTLLRELSLNSNDITGIIGGPPCQGFSTIGQGNVNDDRNQLFVKFFELVSEIHPSFFVAENVPGIMNPKYDNIRDKAFSFVDDYVLLDPVLVNASEYGAPTNRTRYFFIGFLKHSFSKSFSANDIYAMKVPESNKTNVGTALEGLPEIIRFTKKSSGIRKIDPSYFDASISHKQSIFFWSRVTGTIPHNVGDITYIEEYQTKHIVNGCFPTKHSDAVRKRYAKLLPCEQDVISKSKKLDPNGFCPTLRAGTGPEKGSYQAVRPIHYKYPRVITPREAARLQGFPDWYKLPETIWHGFRQIGNSVSPIAAEMVFTAIYQKLTNI